MNLTRFDCFLGALAIVGALSYLVACARLVMLLAEVLS